MKHSKGRSSILQCTKITQGIKKEISIHPTVESEVSQTYDSIERVLVVMRDAPGRLAELNTNQAHSKSHDGNADG